MTKQDDDGDPTTTKITSKMNGVDSNFDLITGQHASVYDFGDILAGSKAAGTEHDYIVLEFDGMRQGHTNYDISSHSNRLTKLQSASDQ